MTKTNLIELTKNVSGVLRGILLTPAEVKNIVLMCGGFERSATTEKKFKTLADQLFDQGVASLRFDFSGCGLSDGDFSTITVGRMAKEIRSVYGFLQEKFHQNSIGVVTHSLGACAVTKLLKDLPFKKIVFLAPAWNQKDLLRFWFVVNYKKKQHPEVKITWQNHKDFLQEESFIADGQTSKKMTKSDYLAPDYFNENKEMDYSSLITNNPNIMLIHGDSDDKVPPESIKISFQNSLVIKNGDHDLERPDMIDQWLKPVINFLI